MCKRDFKDYERNKYSEFFAIQDKTKKTKIG